MPEYRVFLNPVLAYKDRIADSTAQKMTFSSKNFFNKYDQIRRKLATYGKALARENPYSGIFCSANHLSGFYVFI